VEDSKNVEGVEEKPEDNIVFDAQAVESLKYGHWHRRLGVFKLISLILPLSGNEFSVPVEAKNMEEGVEEKDNVLFQVDGYTASVENLKYES
jgi:hypothetical protein